MKVGIRDLFFVGVVGAGAVAMGAGLLRTQQPLSPQAPAARELSSDLGSTVKAVDDLFHKQWSAAQTDRRQLRLTT